MDEMDDVVAIDCLVEFAYCPLMVQAVLCQLNDVCVVGTVELNHVNRYGTIQGPTKMDLFLKKILYPNFSIENKTNLLRSNDMHQMKICLKVNTKVSRKRKLCD